MDFDKTKTCGCSDDFHRGVIFGLCITAIIIAIVAICL